MKSCTALQWMHRNFMMTSSNGTIFRVTGPLCGEFTGHRWIPSQRPVTQSFGVFFDLRRNKRLSKQSWGWRFETPSTSLWRHRNIHMFCDKHEQLEIKLWKYCVHVCGFIKPFRTPPQTQLLWNYVDLKHQQRVPTQFEIRPKARHLCVVFCTKFELARLFRIFN